ncbi:MAG: SDR family NAD(P)-dependent oxidoreductase [Bacteroidota bacterium]
MISGKNILVVGGTDGIGREIANRLVKQNRVLIIGRSKHKGSAFEDYGGANATFIQADISILKNVVEVCHEIKTHFDNLDIVVHTADILRVKRLNTEEGLEKSIATNYYSRFLFNHILLHTAPVFSPTRIIHIAAAGFPAKKRFLESFPLSPKASSFKGHGIGQIANDLYGLRMNRILKTRNTRVNILNPGVVDTDIRRNGQFPKVIRLLGYVLGFLMKSRQKRPSEYVEIPLAIIYGHNKDADSFVLFNPKGKGIHGNSTVRNSEIQDSLYKWTLKDIERIIGKLYY